MLIDASGDEFWSPMSKSLGDKRREIREEHQQKIYDLFQSREQGKHVKIFDTTDFMYRRVQVERPLKLNFCNSSERIERLKGTKAFVNLATSKKKDPEAKAKEEAEGKALQQSILNALQSIPSDLVKDRDVFEGILDRSFSSHGLSVKAPIKKAIFNALGERDESAEICRNRNGQPEPDSELRDHENIPFNESISEYMKREVLPHVPDAWVDDSYTDHKDGKVGRVGTEISFTRYFYVYKPPRKLSKIEDELSDLQAQITQILEYNNQAVTKGLDPNVPMKDSGIPWLGKIPTNWDTIPLKYFISLKSGDSISSENIRGAGNYKVYGGNGLRGYTNDFTHQGEHVLIGRQGALCGNVNYAKGKFWATEHAIVATPTKKLNTTWLGEMIRSMNLNQYSESAAQPGLSVAKIINLRTAFPPPEEQNKICDFLDSNCAKLDNLMEKASKCIELLKEYKTSLISSAVTGKIDVRNYKSGEPINN